jgi:uncharacterized protein YndB with AHSA1/START domain
MTVKAAFSATIARPPQDVFAVLTDVPHFTDWAKGPDRITDVSDDPAQLGTTWTQFTKLLGREIETHVKVNVYEAAHKFGYEADQPIAFHMVWQLEPSGSDTRVNVVVEGEPEGFFAVATPLVRKAMGDLVSGDLARLKTQLEAKA